MISVAGLDSAAPDFKDDLDLSFEQVRKSCGYTDSYTEYVTLAMIGAIALSLLNLLISLSSRICLSRSACARMGSFMNLTIRLTWILSLEVLFSICINARRGHFNLSDPRETTLLVGTILAAIFLSLLVFGLLSSLFCGCGLGRHAHHLFAKGTFWRSCFEARPLNDIDELTQMVRDDATLYGIALAQNEKRSKLQRFERHSLATSECQ